MSRPVAAALLTFAAASPALQADIRAGLVLPLRVLVQDAGGRPRPRRSSAVKL